MTAKTLEAADEHAQPGRVKEGHSAQVRDDVLGALIKEVDHTLAQQRSGVNVDLAGYPQYNAVGADTGGLQVNGLDTALHCLRGGMISPLASCHDEN